MLDSNLFWLLIIITSGLIEWYIFKYVLDEASHTKSNKLFLNLIFLLPICVLLLLTVIGLKPVFKLLISLTMGFAIYKLNYETTILKSLFICLFYFMLVAGADTLGSSLVILINNVTDANLILDNNIIKLEIYVISKLLLLFLIPIIRGIRLRVEISKKEYIQIIIPVIANLICIVSILSLLFSIPSVKQSQRILAFVTSFVLILSNFSLILIVSSMIKNNDTKVNNRIIKIKERLDFKYYSQLQRTKLKTLYKTNNLALDIILSEKKFICDDNKIDFNAAIDFTKCNFIETIDIYNIFSNLLENSIEECEKIKVKNAKRKIKLTGKKVCKYYVIKCETSKSYEIINDENIITVDRDSPPSINLDSIKKSLNKYNGDIVLDYNGNVITTTILIPLIIKYKTVDI
ncbi:GHKL domain-containing protein [Clostridioides mangenotii]|uniref:GHKL domain-containing protein n=1 Tax=Metaclostridioides mangenotii TaxID=1540 RepID=UPI002149E218|nr:GHKL domain-containing protein [Clostridioides mangenotii]MCR1954716.1 GHKL domain-containing protein [Clostridioides mangenotii]